jgi:hypothetical protein
LGFELPSSPGEDEPAVESGGPTFTAAAGFHSKGVSHTLDGIAQANILVGDEPWKANLVSWMARLCLIGVFLIHRYLFLAVTVASDSYDLQASSSGGTTVFRRPE